MKTLLHSAWWQDEGAGLVVGTNAVDELWIENDGNGPAGYYDRVHCIRRRHHSIYPAHNMQGWRLLEDTNA